MYRSMASGGLTVWLKKGESLSYQMHFNGFCSITLSYIRYSNDGSEDTVQVFINDTLLGSFETSGYSNYGYNWNHFYIRDGFAEEKLLLNSQYLLNLSVPEADFYGVEIDVIAMKLHCSTMYMMDDNEDDECQGSLIAFEANVINEEESSENQGSLIANKEESSESGQFVCTATVEAENGYHDGGHTMYRSRASGGLTVWLKKGESLSYQMHFNGFCSIRLSYIRYSNGGSEDTVQVFINDTLLGSFETSGYSNYGYNWNRFYIRDGFADGNYFSIHNTCSTFLFLKQISMELKST